MNCRHAEQHGPGGVNPPSHRNVVVLQPMFFPWVGCFEQIRLADTYVHYNDVQYSKGGFTARVEMRTAQGKRWMTAPVLTKGKGWQNIRDVVFNDSMPWREKHIRMLRQNYGKTPYFDEMIELVEDVYALQTDHLWELNRYAIEKIADYFDIRPRFVVSSDIRVDSTGSEKVVGTVLKLGGTRYITGHGALNYLNHDLFENNDIRVEYMDYKRTPYPQIHGGFDPHVTILDLIANLGRAGKQQMDSPSVYWRDFLDERDLQRARS